MSISDSLATCFDSSKDKILSEFFEYLRFQSISTDPAYESEIKKCSEWLKAYLESSGFTVSIWQGEGHPCIFAEKISAPDAPTVLLYNHYDVQPVDPLELWESPPFEPTERDGEIYARGAEDNKGQSFYVLRALKTLHELSLLPAVNIKLLIEGEEECGSKSLPALLEKHQDKIRADYLLVVDCGFPSMKEPAITLGCRGTINMTIHAQGSKADLHSGEHGGIVYNPLHALVEILGKARSSETGEILVPGFYDNVELLPENEKKELALDLDPEFYRSLFASDMTGGEKKFSPLESAWLRPTLEINGLSGGYSGPGFKTVIPAQATAKVSCRLVPDQDPRRIAKLVSDFFIQNAPAGITINVKDITDTGEPFRSSPASKIAEIVRSAYTEVMELPCNNILAGGSIPIAAELSRQSKSETILMGFGLPDDNIHAPNEHFGIERIKKGMMTIGAILERLGKNPGTGN
jgi:acetylornithine deacetylase/succinyl-diaminopimelate desuccinylase-like protein